MRQALHVVRDLVEASGGTSVSVPQLARYTEQSGRFENTVLSFEREGTLSARVLGGLAVRVEPWDPLGLYGAMLRPGRLDGFVRDAEVVQIHGIWQAHCVSFGRYCRARRMPYVVSAHGMLDAWAVRHKRWKKSAYAALAERRNLGGASCLRALTMQEAEDYRRFGLRNPVAVIGNGVELPTAEMLDPERFLGQWPELRGRRLVIFLSRLHEKKGVDILARSWGRLAGENPDWHLVVAGPNNGDCRERLEAMVRERGLAERVTFTGMLDSEMKWSALGASEVFALPSHSEGFSVAVLEALAAGLRVLLTPGCNFGELRGKSFARVVEAADAPVAEGLAALMGMDREDARRAGEEGRTYVGERYSWAAIGEQMADVYDWVLGGAKPASCPIE